jgi:Cu-Zn family superoxide dismutase
LSGKVLDVTSLEQPMKRILASILLSSLSLSSLAQALEVDMTLINADGVAQKIGKVEAADSPYGLMLTPALTQLPPGAHGFHLHALPHCGPGDNMGMKAAGFAAGGHWDPLKTGRHEGPYGMGHKGDLPVLLVDDEGVARTPVLAPRLTVADLAGHALMIHSGGDNYSDHPMMGGGGVRIACGEIAEVSR